MAENSPTPSIGDAKRLMLELPGDLQRDAWAILQSPQTPYQQLIFLARLARHDARIAVIVRALAPHKLTRIAGQREVESRAIEAELARAGCPLSQKLSHPCEDRAGRTGAGQWKASETEGSQAMLFDPEFPPLAQKAKKLAELRLWAVLRQAVGESGRPYQASSELYDQVCQLVREYTPQHFRRLLKSGAGVFWALDTRGRVVMFGGERVAANLVRLVGETDNLPGDREMYIPIGGNLQEFRTHCLGAWYAHGKNSTFARETVAKIWGVSERTLRRWDARNPQTRSQHNYGQILITEQNAKELAPYLRTHEEDPSVRHTFDWHGQSIVTRQLPNTYLTTGYRQAARRGRARKRRDAAKRVLSSIPVTSGAGHKGRLYWQDGKRLERHNRRQNTPTMAWVHLGTDWRGFHRWELTTGLPETHVNAVARGRRAAQLWSDSAARRRAYLSKVALNIFVRPYSGKEDLGAMVGLGGAGRGGGGRGGGETTAQLVTLKPARMATVTAKNADKAGRHVRNGGEGLDRGFAIADR